MKILLNILILATVSLNYSFMSNTSDLPSLTVLVTNLKNSNGAVQFSLYNKEGSIPDENFERYYKQLQSKIINNTSTVTFQNLPKGVYAIAVLHDENENRVIDKGWVLPLEGIGFSNLKSISPLNKPNFKKTKFTLNTDLKIKVKVIYL